MLIDNMLAYAEIDEILNLLEDEYRESVPEKVRDFFREERMPNYTPKIEIEKPLTEQKLKRETMVLLAILYINYWCDNDEEKQRFINEMAKNEKEKRELEEKYNPDKLFNNRTKEDTVIERVKNVEMIQYRGSVFKKLREWIRKIFNKGK